MAELASHIAEIFTWYQGTFNVDEFNLAKYIYDKGDISQSSNIFQKFEINFAEAKKAIEDSDEANYFNNWTLKAGEAVFIGPLPKIQAIRGFLYNHIYHILNLHLIYLGHNYGLLYDVHKYKYLLNLLLKQCQQESRYQ